MGADTRHGWIAAGIVGVAARLAVVAAIVMLLWNWLLPAILGAPSVGYWQALGLTILGHLAGALVRGGDHRRRPRATHRQAACRSTLGAPRRRDEVAGQARVS